MLRRTHIAAFILIIAAASLFTGFAWKRTQADRQPTQPAESQQSVGNELEAETGDEIQRDVLINAKQARRAPALSEGKWVNSDALTIESLKGRVVLVDFWTYGCYNCRNTLPALKRFDERYRNQGLTIIGVHTPEFDHEKELPNLRKQVRELGILYPVVTDNDYATWRAYGVRAWPTVVILDKQGRIRWLHIGEGLYDEQESVIKKLLAE